MRMRPPRSTEMSASSTNGFASRSASISSIFIFSSRAPTIIISGSMPFMTSTIALLSKKLSSDSGKIAMLIFFILKLFSFSLMMKSDTTKNSPIKLQRTMFHFLFSLKKATILRIQSLYWFYQFVYVASAKYNKEFRLLFGNGF